MNVASRICILKVINSLSVHVQWWGTETATVTIKGYFTTTAYLVGAIWPLPKVLHNLDKTLTKLWSHHREPIDIWTWLNKHYMYCYLNLSIHSTSNNTLRFYSTILLNLYKRIELTTVQSTLLDKGEFRTI